MRRGNHYRFRPTAWSGGKHGFQRLNDASDISETTKAMILHTAVEMGYASRRVQKSGLRKMCIFAEEESFQREDRFGYDLAMGFRVAAAQNGWQVSTASYRSILDSQDPVDTYMLRHDLAGAFFIRRHFSPDCLKPLTNTPFPRSCLRARWTTRWWGA